ncbi:MAG: hypothetical protein H6729_03880 [Deltaproteobacteria bacterium]|nr:hypothetical protein [Deltaproteobacteria bacterium]
MSGRTPSEALGADGRSAEALRRILKSKTGLGLTSYAIGRIEAMLRQRAEAVLAKDVQDYVRQLTGSGGAEELQRLVNLVTVPKTSFYRHPEQIRALVANMVPALHRVLPSGEPIRVWSAACSTGEEPYTVALALEDSGWFARRAFEIVGSDINTESLERARRGRYRVTGYPKLPSWIRARLVQSDDVFFVESGVQARVQFERRNLVEAWPTDDRRWHIVLCANVLIYFDPETVNAVLSKLERSMAPRSFMLVGPSESLSAYGSSLPVARFGNAYACVRGDWGGVFHEVSGAESGATARGGTSDVDPPVLPETAAEVEFGDARDPRGLVASARLEDSVGAVPGEKNVDVALNRIGATSTRAIALTTEIALTLTNDEQAVRAHGRSRVAESGTRGRGPSEPSVREPSVREPAGTGPAKARDGTEVRQPSRDAKDGELARIARAIAEGGDQRREALRALMDWRSREPGRALVTRLLGLAFFRDRRFAEAKDAFEAAIEADALAFDLYFHLGCVYRNLSWHQESIREFRRALFLEPGFRLARYELAQTLHILGDYAAAIREYGRAKKATSDAISDADVRDRFLGLLLGLGDELWIDAGHIAELCTANAKRAEAEAPPLG